MVIVAALLSLGIAPAHAIDRPWPGNPVGILTNPFYGMVMDLRDEGGADSDRTAIQGWPFLGADNQRWSLKPTDGNYGSIQSARSGKCVDVQWGSTADGAPIWQWPCTRDPAQLWEHSTIFHTRADGVRTVLFRNKRSGKCLTASRQHEQLIQLPCSTGDLRQEWALTTSPEVFRCSQNTPAAVIDDFFAAGNRNTLHSSPAGNPSWPSPGGFLRGDLVRFTASGRIQIATWGADYGPDGKNESAPDNGRWPLPGAPKYSLLMRVRSGSALWVDPAHPKFRTAMTPGQWHFIGGDSGCLVVDGLPEAVEFLINDDNIGDNNNELNVRLRQWRPAPNDYYGG
ncbi:hypothetical protein A8W25_06945 [Streptomyces sp. ERV7]|uniref:RICIN domain-containing protein n=1 Tax=Streptomyces sp. ERV7 TaxID=1322334 RepID=UPI0007F55B1F|nr:RICIN domain-containing protein [Streptomyces sp. ERV7]OAR25358.1 hypothetical protein A8W25_06945 [Streptomyces sp. ERV7]